MYPSLILATFSLITAISSFFLSIFLKDSLNFSGFQIGIIYSIQAITGIFAAFPTGIANDRVTSKTFIIISLVIQAFCFILIAFIKSFWVFTLNFFVWSLAVWIFRSSIDVQFLKFQAQDKAQDKIQDKTSEDIGFYQACRFSGLFVGTIGCGYLISLINFEKTFIISGILCVFLAVISKFLPETPVSKAEFSSYKADFVNLKILFFVIWVILFTSHWGAEQTSYPLFLKKNLELSLTEIGWYMGVEFISIVFATVLAGKLINNNKLKLVIILGILFSGIGLVGMIFKPIWVSVLFRIIHGIGDGFMFVVFYYGIAKLFALERLGGSTGLANSASMIGYIIGSLFYGPIGEKFGYQVPMWTSGVLLICLSFPFFFDLAKKK